MEEMIARACLRLLLTLLVAALLPAQTDEQAQASRRAKDLMARGRYADAALIYERLVAALPGNPGLRLNLAMALHLSAEDQKAIPHFEAVLKQQPNALPALMLLGASYLRTGAPARAVPLLERALAQAPDDLEGRSMLADALLLLDRQMAALPHLKRLAAAAPESPRAWYALGRAYEAVSQQSFERIGKVAPASPWWLALTAEVRLNEGRNTAAFALYRAALDARPNFRGAHAALAEIYRRSKHADWAETELQRESKIPPPACAPPSAECHFEKGRFEAAFTLALGGASLEALYWRSKAAGELARAAFARLEKLPPSPEYHQALGELYRNQGRHGEAIGQWRKALALSPGDPHFEQELATSIYMSRDYAAAERKARELLKSDPNVAELQFILGDSLLNQQQPEEAVEPLRRALALNKDYVAAHAVLGRALVQLGQGAEAVPHLKAALSTDTDGTLHFQLSRAYQGAGEAALAAQALAEYQKLRQATTASDLTIGPPR